MKRNLIVARCGENSLHPRWLQGAEPEFDLVVTFYGEKIPQNWQNSGYPIVEIKGSKWGGLYKYLTAHMCWKKYTNIFLPDDDLLFDATQMNRLFALANHYSAPLCQPALDERSYFSHPITLACKSFESRITNFVELMCPCFSVRLLELALPAFLESASGWGMDFYWSKILSDHNMKLPMIFDAVPITHTRPVGAANNGTDGSSNPDNEMRALFKKYQVVRDPTVTIAGVLKTGEVLDRSTEGDRLAVHLVRDAMGMIGRMSPHAFISFLDEIVSDTLPRRYHSNVKNLMASRPLSSIGCMFERNTGSSMNLDELTASISHQGSSRPESLHELLQYHDSRFIEAAYELLLGRKPDEDGYEFYLSRIRRGVDKIQVLKEISRSPEAASRSNSVKGLQKALRMHTLGSLPVVGFIFRQIFSLEGNSKLEMQYRILEHRNSVLCDVVSAISSQQSVVESNVNRVLKLLVDLSEQLKPLPQRIERFEVLHARDIQGLAPSIEELRQRQSTDAGFVEELRQRQSAAVQSIEDLRQRQSSFAQFVEDAVKRESSLTQSIELALQQQSSLAQSVEDLLQRQSDVETQRLPGLLQTLSDINKRQLDRDNDQDNLTRSVPVALRKLARDIAEGDKKLTKLESLLESRGR